MPSVNNTHKFPFSAAISAYRKGIPERLRAVVELDFVALCFTILHVVSRGLNTYLKVESIVLIEK